MQTQTLDEIRSAAQRNFPTVLLRGAKRALCLFGGATSGRNDLIHLLDAGVKEVTVVEPSVPRIEVVRELFPTDWRYVCDEPATICAQLDAKGEWFDVVVCDGSGGTVDHVWEDLLPFILRAAGHAIVRISGEFLSLYELDASAAAVVQLVLRLHGLSVTVEPLQKRSSGQGGVYWAILRGSPQSAAAPPAPPRTEFDDIGYGKERCVLLRDLMGVSPCLGRPSCGSVVNAFRTNVVRKERQSIFRVYTPSRFQTLPVKKVDSLELAGACFDLSRFETITDALAAARVITSKKGRVNREISKARDAGYVVRPFNKAMYVPDMYAIHTSKEVRGGKRVKAHYLATIAEMGGAPTRRHEYTPPSCVVHFNECWGVFHPELGHLQGEVVTDERLVGYINLLRYGNHAWYGRIMGHADHLQKGIMYLLHFTLIEHLLGLRETGLRYVFYGGINSGPADGSLRDWKTRCLFEPRYLIYDEVEDWRGGRGMVFMPDTQEVEAAELDEA